MTAKKVFESNNWLITNIKEGTKNVRIDARAKFMQCTDGTDRFSEWISKAYANQLCNLKFGKKYHEMNCYSN